MEKKRRYALIGGVAAALLVIAVVVTWQVAQHRAEQSFIAEQYAQLEEEENAELEEAATPFLDSEEVGLRCRDEWEKSDDVRRYWEIHSVTTRNPEEVSVGLYSISGHASGTDGRKDIESNFSCSALLDDGEWKVELL